VAAGTGYSRTSITNLEAGNQNPTLRQLLALAAYYDLTLLQLLAPLRNATDTGPVVERVIPEEIQPLWSLWQEVAGNDRQALQRCAEFLASSDVRIRRRMIERIEDVDVWREKYQRERGSEGSEGGDKVAG
jgi:transcriptional regulator with XRE-family HTH domain